MCCVWCGNVLCLLCHTSSARRAQSMEYLNEPKRNSMVVTSNEGSRTVAAVLTPKLFRNSKLKKVSDGDTNSLSGSLCEYEHWLR